MIPNLLNSTYDKRLMPTETLSDEERLALFGDKDSRLHSNLSEEEAKKLLDWFKQEKFQLIILLKIRKISKLRNSIKLILTS